MGTKACKWAQRCVSRHIGASVGTEAYQWRRSVSVGTNACKWAQRRVSEREDGIGKTSINKGEPVQVGQTSQKARRRRKIFSHFLRITNRGGGFFQ